jgi:hypothetical protein
MYFYSCGKKKGAEVYLAARELAASARGIEAVV